MGDDKYADLPRRIDMDETVVEVDPYEAVEPIRGVRQVSPLSPVAGIDEARLYAEIATDDRTEPGRRRTARTVVLVSLLLTPIVWVIFAVKDVLER